MPPALNQSSQTNTPSILSTTGDIITTNLNRRYWAVQNVGTNPLFILLGSGASSSVFHMVLKGGSAPSDGLGGSASSSNVVYTGIVSIAGTSPLYVITEM